MHRLVARHAKKEAIVLPEPVMPNLSIELTCPVKPGHAPHVKR
jgi:hypothetical protein